MWVLGVTVLIWGVSRFGVIARDDPTPVRWTMVGIMVAGIVLGLVMLIFGGAGAFLVPLVLGIYLIASSPVGTELVEGGFEMIEGDECPKSPTLRKLLKLPQQANPRDCGCSVDR
jgi:uncharacterized membrane protein HdeD (DUF308 family)